MTPAISRLLLTLAAGGEDAPFVIGDLEEEFGALRQTRGIRFARRWYRRQVRVSIAPLVRAHLQEDALPARILTALLLGFAPLLLLDRMWSLAYSGIPWKDGTAREPWMLGINLAVSVICVSLQPAGRTWLTTVAMGLALCFSIATLPFWYIGAALAIAPSVLCIQLARRRFA